MKIKTDLKTWVQQDQFIRNKYLKFVVYEWSGDYLSSRLPWMVLHNTTDLDFFGTAKQENSRHKKLLRIFTRIPWHSFKSDDWNNLWLIAQHADQLPILQKKVLDKLKQFSSVGKNIYHIRYLEDRLRLNQFQSQRYYTQNNAWKINLSPHLQRRWKHI